MGRTETETHGARRGFSTADVVRSSFGARVPRARSCRFDDDIHIDLCRSEAAGLINRPVLIDLFVRRPCIPASGVVCADQVLQQRTDTLRVRGFLSEKSNRQPQHGLWLPTASNWLTKTSVQASLERCPAPHGCPQPTEARDARPNAIGLAFKGGRQTSAPSCVKTFSPSIEGKRYVSH
jgi:hypothetical protein